MTGLHQRPHAMSAPASAGRQPKHGKPAAGARSGATRASRWRRAWGSGPPAPPAAPRACPRSVPPS
eukprot:7540709-Alexandrium_andersonii.AAC.1